MLSRLGRFAFRRRWFIVGAWLLLFAGSALLAPRVTGVLKGGGYSTPSSQASLAYSAAEKVYGSHALVFTAVFSASGAGTLALQRRAADRFAFSVRHDLHGQLEPGPPQASDDRRVVFIRLFGRPRADYGIPLTARVRDLLPRLPGVASYVTGASATFYDMERESDDDIKRMEIITFPIALIILVVIFGTLVGSFVPVAMGPLTVAASLAAVFLLGHVLSMSIFVLNTVTMLGLGVAIDYSLFMVQRYREELRRTNSVEAAVEATVSKAGRAILVSAVTVAIGFLGMVIFDVPMLTSLGIGGSVVVALSLLAAVTLLPALLSLLGGNINALSVLPRTLTSEPAWRALAKFVMRRPWQVLGGVFLVVIVLALPAGHLRVGVPGVDILPASAQSRQGDALLSKHIGIANTAPVLVVFESHHAFRATRIQAGVVTAIRAVCSHNDVVGIGMGLVVDSQRQILPCRSGLSGLKTIPPALMARDVLPVAFYVNVDPSSAQAESTVHSVRALHLPPGVSMLVGGQTAAQIDFDNFIYSRFPIAILFVVGAILVVLALSFRSLLLPLKAVVMNGFSVLAAYGVTVFIFQDGHFQGFFGFTPVGSLDSIVPIFLFCVLFGLSTDYEVFLLMRAREEFVQSRDNAHSVSVALQRTGKMITSAALIMVVVFAAFSFANLVVIKELGLALAIGVAVDATLIRALMVPAAMRILGRWNWWPGIGLSRVHEHGGRRETAGSLAPAR